MNKKSVIILRIIIVLLAISIWVLISYYQNKEKTLTCKAQGNYLNNTRTYEITYLYKKPKTLKNIAIYENTNQSEFQSALNANQYLIQNRLTNEKVKNAYIKEENNTFTVYTEVDLIGTTYEELKKIDGYYMNIMQYNDKIKNIKEFLESQGFTCEL